MQIPISKVLWSSLQCQSLLTFNSHCQTCFLVFRFYAVILGGKILVSLCRDSTSPLLPYWDDPKVTFLDLESGLELQEEAGAGFEEGKYPSRYYLRWGRLWPRGGVCYFQMEVRFFCKWEWNSSATHHQDRDLVFCPILPPALFLSISRDKNQKLPTRINMLVLAWYQHVKDYHKWDLSCWQASDPVLKFYLKDLLLTSFLVWKLSLLRSLEADPVTDLSWMSLFGKCQLH